MAPHKLAQLDNLVDIRANHAMTKAVLGEIMSYATAGSPLASIATCLQNQAQQEFELRRYEYALYMCAEFARKNINTDKGDMFDALAASSAWGVAAYPNDTVLRPDRDLRKRFEAEQDTSNRRLTDFFGKDEDFVDFGGFLDRDGWNGPHVSQDLVCDRFVEEVTRLEPHYLAILNGTTGTMAKSDHTFKLARTVNSHHGHVFGGFYTIMNEVGQLLGCQLVSTTSMDEVILSRT